MFWRLCRKHDAKTVRSALDNDDFVSVLDYLKDYIVVFDESEEVYAKYEYFEQNYDHGISPKDNSKETQPEGFVEKNEIKP